MGDLEEQVCMCARVCPCVYVCVPVRRCVRVYVCVYELTSGTCLGPTRPASGPTGLTERVGSQAEGGDGGGLAPSQVRKD